MDNVSTTKNNVPQAVTLISSTTVIGMLYTCVLVLYYLSARFSYTQLRDFDGKLKRQTTLTMILASAMVICATMDVTLANIHIRKIYIDYVALPGGPLGFQAALHSTTVTRVKFCVNAIENLLISGVLVWRVLVVWTGTRFVKPFTLLLYVAHAVIVIMNTVLQWKNSGKAISSLALPHLAQTLFITSTTITAAFMVYMTSMLVIRLMYIRWQHIEIMGKSETADQYLSIAAILIESYALDTAWNIAFCITCAVEYAPLDNFFFPTVIQIDILTNLLVIYRVVSGRAWDRQTQEHFSSLRWNHHGQSDGTVASTVP